MRRNKSNKQHISSADRARHIAGCSTMTALDLILGLRTPASVAEAIELEHRCQARSAILDALNQRMQKIRSRK